MAGPGAPVKMVKKVTMIAILFAIVGALMAWSAIILEQTTLNPLQEEYFFEHNKAERDSAEVGSDLARTNTDIQNLKPTLLALKLVGIATILFGITIALLAILRMLSLMPVGLADVLRANLEDMGLGRSD